MIQINYKRLVEKMNYGRTWIKAEFSSEKQPYWIMIDGRMQICYSPSIILKVVVPQDGYNKRQKWILPEMVLESTARQLKAQDEDFWRRLTSEIMTYEDIERLILKATYGKVNLCLED